MYSGDSDRCGSPNQKQRQMIRKACLDFKDLPNSDKTSNDLFRCYAPTSAKSLPPIEAIIWDVYGTLLASRPTGLLAEDPSLLIKALSHLKQAFPELASLDSTKTITLLQQEIKTCLNLDHKQPPPAITDRRESTQIYLEIDIVMIWKEVFKKFDLFEFHSEKELPGFALAFELATHPFALMPGILPLLSTLLAKNLHQGIMSNAQFYTHWILETLLGKNLFASTFNPELLVYSFEHSIAKPSHLLFTNLVERLEKQGISPDKTLYLGNNLEKDILPAKRVGLRTGWVLVDPFEIESILKQKTLSTIEPNEPFGKPQNKASPADIIITSFYDFAIKLKTF
ncbi:MAG: HAD family hydrolase [Pirellulaceae bacterium]|nr:HAD family hydrolase [Pirellulaceae bacterium]